METRVPMVARLSPADVEELLGHTRVLLDEKRFEGAAGLLMRDEVAVTIAAQAAVLLLHRDTDYFARLTSVIVYPSAYVAADAEHVEGGIWSEGDEYRAGHTARDLRALVLAWDEVRAGAGNPNDGRNLVLHEFAHQLDFEDGSTDGTPLLESGAQAKAWAQVFGAELDALRHAADAGELTLLDPYGAQDPAEFFAVATETFFERGAALRERHPSLYAELQRFYRQDPATWPDG